MKTTPNALGQGFNGDGFARVPVWYTQSGPQFRNETFCDQVEGVRNDHHGWLTDDWSGEVIRGIVAALPHGRFIAGYLSTMNDERVYFGDVFDSARDAAHMADEHARVVAEEECRHNARCDEAQQLENKIEDSLQRLRECFVLRHTACMQYVRDEISELAAAIRKARDQLATDYAEVL